MITLKALAKRGLEYDEKINQMLVEIWTELQAIEPQMANAIKEALGSEEFAAMMTMGRVKGQPSLLEKLADAAPVSSDGMVEIWQDFVAQATGSSMGLGRECQFDLNESLSRKAERAKKDYELALVDIFKELKKKDPEVAAAALGIWEGVSDAAEFVASPVKSIGDQMPLALVENGRREEVLTLINAIKYGFPT